MTLAPGFLIAMPQLGDPHFQRAVVLMIEHGDAGAMGLMLTRTAPIRLKDLAEDESFTLGDGRAEQPIYVGGPVEPQRGFVLHNSTQVEERHEVLPGLYLSVTVDALKPLLADPGCQLRLCLGYSGWGPQQIERELAEGSWLFTEASALPALKSEPGQLWDATLRGMGVNPAMLVTGGGIH